MTLQTSKQRGRETRCCSHAASFPGRGSLTPTLLGLASDHRYAKLEGNHSGVAGDINPLYYRWKASKFKCIRSPAATVTQNYIVCRTTVCHLCKNRQETFPMRSDKNRSCLFKSTPLVGGKKKKR